MFAIIGAVFVAYKITHKGSTGASWDDIAAIDAMEMGSRAPSAEEDEETQPDEHHAAEGRHSPEQAPPLPISADSCI